PPKRTLLRSPGDKVINSCALDLDNT
ncbi:splicing factor 3B subunit 2, partial [Trichonephila inaurata madagascariensis]